MTAEVGTCLALFGLVAYAGGFALWARAQRRHAEVWAMLEECQRCNEDFGEAISLLEYGARDEAAEVLRRWRERQLSGDGGRAHA